MFSKPGPGNHDDGEFTHGSLPSRDERDISESMILADQLRAAYQSGSAREFVQTVLDLMKHPRWGHDVPFMAGIHVSCQLTASGGRAPDKESLTEAKQCDASEASVQELLNRLSPVGKQDMDWNLVKAAAMVWFAQGARKRPTLMKDWRAAAQ